MTSISSWQSVLWGYVRRHGDVCPSYCSVSAGRGNDLTKGMLGVLWRSMNTTREFELLWTPQAKLQCLDLSSTWALILKLFIAELVLCIGNGWNSKPMGEEMPGTGHSTISEKYLMWQCKTKQKNQLKPTVSHINWGFILLSKTETQQALLTWDVPEMWRKDKEIWHMRLLRW